MSPFQGIHPVDGHFLKGATDRFSDSFPRGSKNFLGFPSKNVGVWIKNGMNHGNLDKSTRGW